MKKILLLLFLFVFTEKINATYFYYDDEKVSEMFITRTDGETIMSGNPHVLKRVGDNKMVYCIEPLKLVNKEGEYLEYNYNDPVFGISNEKLKKINLISYYGYNYKNHTDLKWYGVTQYLIWKELYPNLDIYFTDSRFGNRITGYEEEIDELNYLVNKDIVGFNVKDLYEITVSKEYEVIENELLDNYDIVNNTSLDVKIIDNKLIIKSLEAGEYEFILKRKKSNDSYYLYYNQTGQNLFSTGGILDDIKIKVLSKTADLTIIKKDILKDENSNITLEGAEYGLYDMNDNLIISGKTNEEGIIKLSNLPLGNYKIKEISPSYGYKLDLKEYEIVLKEDMEYILYEERIKEKVVFNKQYRANENLYPEENATFLLYKDDIFLKEITTNKDGKIIEYLEYGDYLLVQINGKEGYCYSKDYTFKIDENYNQDEILIINEPIEQPKEELINEEDEIITEVLGVKNTSSNYNYSGFIILFLFGLIRYALR